MRSILAVAGLALAMSGGAVAQDYRIENVPSALAVNPGQLKPRTIAFSEQKADSAGASEAGMSKFKDWAQSRPLEKQFLALYPSYGDAAVNGEGADKDKEAPALGDRLYMYVVAARFVLDKPASSIDIARYARLPFVERIDPAIRHRLLAPADIMPVKSAEFTVNRHPDRTWCGGAGSPICIQSHYQFEGKLPTGIMLANKLTDTAKKIPDFIEFQSELRQLAPDELAREDLVAFSGLATPVVAGLQQSTFYVNQILQFGKFLALVQAHPSDARKSVATVTMALAVKASVFERKKEYERVPVLRNLVPAQVLLGNSAFNTGDSISAGLPKYTRNRIAAIAGILSSE